MKPNKLLLTLFVIYWTTVYGASFITTKSFKNGFKPFFPTGYRMYAPATTTDYDVVYEFYSNGEITRTVNLSEKLEKERKDSVWDDKRVFVKRRIYLESLKAFDFDYQMGIYKELKDKVPNDFENRVESDPYLSKIAQSLRNYVKLYAEENPDFKFDSVKISTVRIPTVIAFDPDFRGDFTYKAGKGAFYVTSYKKEK